MEHKHTLSYTEQYNTDMWLGWQLCTKYLGLENESVNQTHTRAFILKQKSSAAPTFEEMYFNNNFLLIANH